MKKQTPIKKPKKITRKTNKRLSPNIIDRFMMLSNRQKALFFGLAFGLIGSIAIIQSLASPQPYTKAGLATQQLDASGKTIPKTNYAIPAGAIFMSPNGNDEADGKTEKTAVKNIKRAVDLAPAGGTIVLKGGEYRQWLQNSSNPKLVGAVAKSLTFQAAPGESPWFNGSDIVNDGWTSDGAGHWYRQWETPSFCNGKYYDYATEPYKTQRNGTNSNGKPTINPDIKQTTCMYEDAANNENYPMAGNPQQAFINDVRQEEVASLSQVADGKFYYDWYKRRMYIGTNPSGKKVELSARPAVMILAGANNNSFAIKGIGFKRYATNGGEGTMTETVMYLARQTLIENSVFTEMSTNGLGMSSPPPGSAIRNSIFAYNGGTGFAANGSIKQGTRNDLLIESNIFNGNNWERGGIYCNRACGPAHIKMAHMAGFVAENNIFENAYEGAHALWCDLNCNDMISVNNVIRNNWGNGIFYEVGNKGIIANNLIYNNGSVGIRVGSPYIKVYNNTVVDNYTPRNEGIVVYNDGRAPSGDIGPNTSNTEIVNNVVVGPIDRTGARLVSPGYSSTGNKFLTSEFDYNAYYRINTKQNLYYYTASSGYDSTGEYKTVGDMQRLSGDKFETRSFSIDNNEDPFQNRGGEDFRLKTTARAYTEKGKPLPADVAAALGLPAGTVSERGVIFSSASTPTPPKQNEPPVVSLGNTQTEYTAPANITLSAIASDPDGKVAKVEFWANNSLLKTVTSASNGSYSYAWNDVPAGNYSITAKATDDEGSFATSTPIRINVRTAPAPEPPKDTTPPTAPSRLSRSLTSSYELRLSWSPSVDTSGIREYQISRNGSLLGTTTNTSYSDNTVRPDTYYTYSVVAIDNSPQANKSAPATISAKGQCFLFWCWLN